MNDDTPIGNDDPAGDDTLPADSGRDIPADTDDDLMHDSMERPAWLPEKFWDSEAGGPRVEALAKSYNHLEQKLGSERRAESLHDGDAPTGPAEDTGGPESDPELRGRLGVPDDPEDYEIRIGHPLLATDPEINARMHALGFSPRQVQFVYDLAAERVMPVIERLGEEQARALNRQQLVDRFGGEERYAEVARQVRAWGEANLPGELFETLSNSAEGVLAMHQLMQSEEPRLLKSGSSPGQARSEDELKRLIDDPRYWRDHDPDVMREVEEGFRRLYPE